MADNLYNHLEQDVALDIKPRLHHQGVCESGGQMCLYSIIKLHRFIDFHIKKNG